MTLTNSEKARDKEVQTIRVHSSSAGHQAVVFCKKKKMSRRDVLWLVSEKLCTVIQVFSVLMERYHQFVHSSSYLNALMQDFPCLP